MIDKKTIATLLSKLTHGQRKVSAKQTIHPKREWFIGLALFVLVTLFGGLLSVYNFTRFSDIHLTLKASTQTVVSYKEQTVKKALSVFGEKKKNFEVLTRGARAVEVSKVPEVTESIATEVASSTLDSEVDVPTTDAVSDTSKVEDRPTATTTAVLEVF